MENLDELLLSIQAGVWQMQFPSRKFIYINQFLADICGIPLSELKQHPEKYNSLIHPHDREKVFNAFKRAAEGTSIDIEYRIITKGGTKWVSHKEMMLCDVKGKFESLAGIITDITPRKRAEEKMADSEQLYRYLFMNNPNPLWIYDINSLKFLAVNDAAVEIYGYSREEFLGMTIADIRPPSDVERLKEEIKNLDVTYKGSRFWKHYKKDGSLIRVAVSSHGLQYEDHMARMVLITDLTDILTMQDELNITSNNLKALINNTPDLIYSIDKNYRLMSANQGFIDHFKKLYGTTLQVGSTLFADPQQSEHRVKWKAVYDRCLQGEHFTLIEESEINSHQSVQEIRFNTMYDNNGKIIGANCFIHDISRQVSNERAIVSQNARLREIAALASHDIRGHVTSIMGVLTILNKEELSPFNKELFAYMEQATVNLDAVIHKIVEKSSNLTRQDPPFI